MPRAIRSVAVLVAAVATTSLAFAAPSQAITTQIDFDDQPAGTTLTTLSGVTFVGSPTVFNPAFVATQSEPNAVHTAGSCNPSGVCTNNANRLEVQFSSPKGSVSWRVGLNDEPSVFEFGTDAELVGFNAGGTPVASDHLNFNTQGDREPITHLLEADSASVNITRAVLTFGTPGTSGGVPRRVNADQLIVTDDQQPVPPAPLVQITAPTIGQAFDRVDDIRPSGRVDAPAGTRRFCVTVTPTAPDPAAFPEACDDQGLLDGSGNFSNLRLRGYVTGENFITAWAEDTRFRRTSNTRRIVVNANDLRVTNMEVSQAVQRMLPVPTPEDADVAHTAEYNGLPLMQGKTTAVRVWTAARLDAAGTPVRGVQVHLLGFDAAGRALPGGPVVPLEGARDLGPGLSFDNPIGVNPWSDPATSWTFRLPGTWIDAAGPISLRAVVNPERAFPRVNECTGCEANNALTLTNLRFDRPRTLHVYPFQVFYTQDGRTVKPRGNFDTDLHGVNREFEEVRAISPFRLAVHPYRGTLNANAYATDSSLSQNQKSSRTKDLLTNAVDIAGYPGFHTMALMKGQINGLNGDHWSWSSFTVRNYSVVNTDRPLTSVGHELYHSIGFEHAGRACAGAVEGGGAASWPPDDRGLLQGVGTDPRPLYLGRPLRLFGLDQRDAEGNVLENFDLMSYCADTSSEFNVWISARYWGEANGRVPARRIAAPRVTAAQDGATLAVNATLFPDGGRIARVEPGRGQLSPAEGDGSVRLIARDAGGNVLTDLPVPARAGHTDPGGGAPAQQSNNVGAVIPAANVASVELVRAGQVLDVRRKTPAAPRASLSAPKGGIRVRTAQRTLPVRFAVSDADGDALETTLEYSADGGKTYRGVASGLTGSSYSLPTGVLTRASKARLRLRVSDGWNQTAAVSRAFRVDGPPPAVAILTPPSGTRIAADQVLNLEGVAYDDRSRLIGSKSLRWFDGRRSLGRGSTLVVDGLRPGKHTLRLVARAGGRTGSTTARVTVSAVTPRFVALVPPASVKRTARTVTLRAASSVAGTLELGKQRFAANRRTRTYRFRIKPGSSALKLKLVLRSGGRTATASLTIPRS